MDGLVFAAFKNVDDFYAWFNQSMESGEIRSF